MENVISVKRRLWTFTIRKRYKPPQFYKIGTPSQREFQILLARFW